MSDNTKIEWTDATWNPITGCSVVSAGCKHCYAMKLAGTRMRNTPSRRGLTVDTKAGPVWNGQVRVNHEWLAQPLTWKRPRRIFVCAHGDLFHESVNDTTIAGIFAIMAACPQHTFQVLTKRAERMAKWFDVYMGDRTNVAAVLHEAAKGLMGYDHPKRPAISDTDVQWPLPNVHLCVSVEDQAAADERIPHLIACPATVRGLSCEPLLAAIDLVPFLYRPVLHSEVVGDPVPDDVLATWRKRIDPRPLNWVIVGGESGHGARPMHPDWARSLRDQCAAAGVPFFFKQWGEWGEPDSIERTGLAGDRWAEQYREDGGATAHEWPGPMLNGVELKSQRPIVYRVGKKAAGRLLDGVEHNGMPA